MKIGEVMLKIFEDRPKYGRILKTTTFMILGNPPYVYAFTKVKKKS